MIVRIFDLRTLFTSFVFKVLNWQHLSQLFTLLQNPDRLINSSIDSKFDAAEQDIPIQNIRKNSVSSPKQRAKAPRPVLAAEVVQAMQATATKTNMAKAVMLLNAMQRFKPFHFVTV